MMFHGIFLCVGCGTALPPGISKRAIDSMKREIDSMKRETDSMKRAIDSIKRVMDSIEIALHFISKPYIPKRSETKRLYSQKSNRFPKEQ